MKVSHALFLNQGHRSSMEDFCSCIKTRVHISGEAVARDVFVQYVCDGHGGAEIAQFIDERIRDAFQDVRDVPSIKDMLISMSNKLTAMVKDLPEAGTTGTTLCLSLLDKQDGKIHVMNCGDSRCSVYSLSSGQMILETKDHSATDPAECDRIINAGGLVFRNKGAPRVMGILAVTRAFGDLELTPYVTSEPDLYEIILADHPGQLVIIVASDGFWNLRRSQSSTIGDFKGTSVRDLVSLLIGKYRYFPDNIAITASIIDHDSIN